MRFDFLALFMPGQRRPPARAAEAGARAGARRATQGLARLENRLDGLYALLDAGDVRDAALLASLTAEDGDAVAAALGWSGERSLAEDRGMLGPLPDAAALAAFAGRVETRLVRLRRALAAKKAGKWATAEDRFAAVAVSRARLALVVVLVLVAGGMLFGETLARRQREHAAHVAMLLKREDAAASLARIARLASRAKTATGRMLWEITGSNCSRCGCDGYDLRNAPAGDVCVRQWDAALARLGAAAGAAPEALAGLARDPWGAPYLLNENEGESPDLPLVRDTVTSVGQNGLAGDGDDITVAVPQAGRKR